MGIYSVVFDKDTAVAIFFTLSQATYYAMWQYKEMGGRFRFRVYGGETCFYDTNEIVS